MTDNKESSVEYGQFNAIDIREIGDQSNPFAFPATDNMCNLIEEPWDGRLGTPMNVKDVVVMNQHEEGSDYVKVVDAADAKFDFYITNSRAILLCKKYDKGSVWFGIGGLGAAAALVGTAVSKISAAVRSKGTVLLGHIRYEWLMGVGYKRKTGWLDGDYVYLYYLDFTDTAWCFYLPFPKGTDTANIANKILQQACKYRLEMNDEKKESDVVFYEKHAKGAKITPADDPKMMSQCFLPSYYYAPGGEEKRPKF